MIQPLDPVQSKKHSPRTGLMLCDEAEKHSRSTGVMLYQLSRVTTGNLDELTAIELREKLPPSWGTLYQLSQFHSVKLEELTASGVIHPAMTRGEKRADGA